MRIVNLKEFLTLPSGTVYMNYKPCIFESLCVKVDNVHEDSIDFILKELVTVDAESSEEWHDKIYDAMENGTSLKLDFNATERDGCFDEEQLFAVLEKEDIKGIIEVLEDCLMEEGGEREAIWVCYGCKEEIKEGHHDDDGLCSRCSKQKEEQDDTGRR
jgi:hypothetical protein